MRIGILGGGQLGRMLALAAHPLGHSVVVLAQREDEPACAVARSVLGVFEDEAALDRLAAAVDVVTYESENVPLASVSRLALRVDVRPGLRSLEVASDRLAEKTTFRALGIGTPPFVAVDDEASLAVAVEAIGLPAVLKTRRLGYDGKGQRVLRVPADVPGAFDALGAPCILEGFVPFSRELSILGVRSASGEVRVYPLSENLHTSGILRVTTAPADVSPALAVAAEDAMRALLSHLDHVGVLALELFDVHGKLLANEIAPRVHNSGHHTIEGALTSQFESHVRAIAGDPLGPTELRCPAAMVNLIGAVPNTADVLALPDVHLHLYGKAPRPGRKLGHVTVCAPDVVTLARRVAAVRDVVHDDG